MVLRRNQAAGTRPVHEPIVRNDDTRVPGNVRRREQRTDKVGTRLRVRPSGRNEHGMKVLFDQCTPKALREALPEHDVQTAHRRRLPPLVDRVRDPSNLSVRLLAWHSLATLLYPPLVRSLCGRANMSTTLSPLGVYGRSPRARGGGLNCGPRHPAHGFIPALAGAVARLRASRRSIPRPRRARCRVRRLRPGRGTGRAHPSRWRPTSAAARA